MSEVPATDAADRLVRFAEAQIAAGRVTSLEQVVRASVEALKERDGQFGRLCDRIVEEMRT